MKKTALSIAATATFLLSPSAAYPSSIYNNLSGTTAGSDGVYSFGPLADSFSTGASGLSMNQVQLILALYGPVTGSTNIELLADSSTHPGAPLATIGSINDGALTDSYATYSFTTSYTLAANTRYWIELISTNNSSLQWAYTSSKAPSTEYFFNRNGVHPNSGDPYQLAVSGSAPAPARVPEPASITLLMTGLLGFAASRQKQERA